MLPALASNPKLDSRSGSGKVLTTSFDPFSPAQMAWFCVLVNHLMNLTAPATFLALRGIPIPSGLATFSPTPLAPACPGAGHSR
jgi:hypothetical protein